MKSADLSKMFSEVYFRKNNRLIEVTLKNGQYKTGVFISFTHGDPENHEPFINRWRIVHEKFSNSAGIDFFGYRLGEIINQKDIKCIKFLDDNTVVNF